MPRPSAPPVLGIGPGVGGADDQRVIWPVAALAVLVLGFVVVYGSTLQARLEPDGGRPSHDGESDTGSEL